MDYEEVFQQHDVTGESMAACELCGRPVSRSRLVAVARAETHREPAESLEICEECWTAMERDELPLGADGAGMLEEDEMERSI